jgi:hypothetical protein
MLVRELAPMSLSIDARDDTKAQLVGSYGDTGVRRASALPRRRFRRCLAILTVHHWRDKEAGLREMRRVTRGRIVVLTFDPSHRPWLTDYLQIIDARDAPALDYYFQRRKPN